MAKLLNDEKNVILEWSLIKNDMLDIEPFRSDYENWIPFKLMLNVDNEKKITFCGSPTLTLEEIKKFLEEAKKNTSENEGKVLFIPVELYFELNVEFIEEDNLVEFECWFNKGILTEGEKYGYCEGYRFFVHMDDFKVFISCLEDELNELIDL